MNPADEHCVDVLAFGERALDSIALPKARLPHDANRGAVTLLPDIERCDGVERRRLVLAAIQKAGFQWLCYWRIRCVGERVRQAAWVDSYSPPGWLEGFRGDGFFDVDPRIGFARGRDWPFAWDIASLFAKRHANPAVRRFAESAERCGVQSGVTIGLPTGYESERAIVTLSSARTDRRWVTDTTMSEAYAIALALHAFIAPRLQRLTARPETDTLSEAQLAVLRSVSKGLNNREIAERLTMSTHVVSNHLRQLEQKCAARNRVQLAYLAGRILYEQQNE